MITRADIVAQYNVDHAGIVRSLGKFEGSPIWAIYFWEACLDGGSDETIEIGGVQYEWMEVSADDLVQFPELAGTSHVVVWQLDNGFVGAVQASAAELETMRAESATDESGNES